MPEQRNKLKETGYSEEKIKEYNICIKEYDTLKTEINKIQEKFNNDSKAKNDNDKNIMD